LLFWITSTHRDLGLISIIVCWLFQPWTFHRVIPSFYPSYYSFRLT
jgi:hypothetical protein